MKSASGKTSFLFLPTVKNLSLPQGSSLPCSRRDAGGRRGCHQLALRISLTLLAAIPKRSPAAPTCVKGKQHARALEDLPPSPGQHHLGV